MKTVQAVQAVRILDGLESFGVRGGRISIAYRAEEGRWEVSADGDWFHGVSLADALAQFAQVEAFHQTAGFRDVLFPGPLVEPVSKRKRPGVRPESKTPPSAPGRSVGSLKQESRLRKQH